MTNKQAKMFAIIHTATAASYFDAFAFMDNYGNQDGIPEKDQQKMVDAIHQLADKILKGEKEIVNSHEIYKHVIANY